MDSEYSESDSYISEDSDSEGSLCDFIVDDEADEVESGAVEEPESSANHGEEDELQSIVNDLREEERALLSEGRPKRKRKQTVRYVDPDYCKLMELDALSQREVEYIMNGSSQQKKKKPRSVKRSAPKPKPAKAKPAKGKAAKSKATKAKTTRGNKKISKKKIRSLKSNR